MIATLLACFLTCAQSSEALPLALRMAEKARRDIGAADIRWRTVQYRYEDDPVWNPRSPSRSGPIERLHHSQVAWNSDFAYEDLGDPAGVYQYNEQGEPDITSSDGILVLKNGDIWNYLRGAASASYYKGESAGDYRPPLLDFRIVGLDTVLKYRQRLGADDVLRVGTGAPTFGEELLGDGTYRVSRRDSRAESRVWYINPAKGWNPERIVVEDSEGRELVRAEVVLQKYGDVWFPKACSTYASGRLIRYVEIQQATFNDPGLKQLSPATIGIERGVWVLPQRGALADGPHGNDWYWDGEKPIDHAELMRQVESGRPLGPSMERLRREGDGHIFPGRVGAARIRDLSEWERYVRDFIRKYTLDADQTERAWKVYRGCKERADQYLARKTEEIARLDAELRKAPGDQELRRKRAALREPLDQIFERELRPGLERIPTAHQREQAKARAAASQPAGPATRGEKEK